MALVDTCRSDLDCELLGTCTADPATGMRRCVCSPGFRGLTCGSLDLLPMPASAASDEQPGRVWPSTPLGVEGTTMAWSFAPAYDPDTHKYYAVVETGCGPQWGQGFNLAALASEHPDRGFEFLHWLSPRMVNSPHLLRTDNGTWILHFQTGRVHWPRNTTTKTCSGAPGNGPPLPSIGVDLPLRPCNSNEIEARDNCLCSTLSTAEPCEANIHIARSESPFSSAAKPWSTIAPVIVSGPGWNPFNASVKNIGESNPAAVLLKDGRELLAFRSHLTAGYWPGVRGEHIGFAMGSSKLGLSQTAFNVTANLSYTTAKGNDEDPFMWQQPDGTLHCLYHNGRGATRNLGLHAFSRDGRVWHKPADARTSKCATKRNCTALYTNEIDLEGGGSVTLTGRERPSLIFDPVTKRPIFLYNGAIPSNRSLPWYSMVQAIGDGSGSSQLRQENR